MQPAMETSFTQYRKWLEYGKKRGLEFLSFKPLIFLVVAGTGFEPVTFGL
jgi:hypothetical protein